MLLAAPEGWQPRGALQRRVRGSENTALPEEIRDSHQFQNR